MTGPALFKVAVGAVAAGVILAGAGYGVGSWRGYSAGYAAAAAEFEADRREIQDRLWAAGEEVDQMARALERQRGFVDEISKEYEAAARADPGGSAPGVGADGLRRVEQQWGRVAP